MVDVPLAPDAAWREAQCRAEVIRPLMECDLRARHLVQVAAETLGLSQRQTHCGPSGHRAGTPQPIKLCAPDA